MTSAAVLERDVAPAPGPARRRAAPAVQVITTAVTIVSVALLGFSVYISFVARLHYDRAQLVAYANFRKDLALGTAPVGQTRPTDQSRLLDPGTPVAVLSIPRLHLTEVVFEGTSGGVLENGPGHRRDTVLPGQAGSSVIMGRSGMYGGPFAGLATLVPDDTFTVTTGQGVHHYRVLDVRRKGMPTPPAPAPGTGRLVLATAYGSPFAPTDVLRVDAEQTSPVQPHARLVLATSQLPPAEQALATDQGAWYAIVLLGEGLVIAAGLIAWARSAWGAWQAWIVALPVVGFLGIATADEVARLLPNLM